MMKNLIRSIIFLSVCLAACNNNSDNGISDQDRQFMRLAGSAGIMEIQMGKLAAKRGARQDVIAYAGAMVASHTRFNDDFHRLLKKIHETVPGTMNEDNRKMVEALKKADADKFDSVYINDVFNDHQAAVEKFKEAIAI